MTETKTPINLDVAAPAMTALATMSQMDENLNEIITYYVDRIGDGYLEKFMEKSNPLVDDEGGWMSEHIRVMPTRMVIVGPDGPSAMMLLTSVHRDEDSATVTILSVNFVAVTE